MQRWSCVRMWYKLKDGKKLGEPPCRRSHDCAQEKRRRGQKNAQRERWTQPQSGEENSGWDWAQHHRSTQAKCPFRGHVFYCTSDKGNKPARFLFFFSSTCAFGFTSCADVVAPPLHVSSLSWVWLRYFGFAELLVRKAGKKKGGKENAAEFLPCQKKKRKHEA